MNEEKIPQVVVETIPYQKAVEQFWDEETQIEFKNYIGMNPALGDIIPGAGGIRKIRWQANGHGKRGGVRVIYYVYNENHPIYLLYAYPKNVQVDLMPAEKKLFRAVVEQLKATFRAKDGEHHE
jgi:mRNA-degrading endonuclease RelE of RelBE toxin-antitoxin system